MKQCFYPSPKGTREFSGLCLGFRDLGFGVQGLGFRI